DALAVGDVAGGRVLRRGRGGAHDAHGRRAGRQPHQPTHEPIHGRPPQRGSVTTSTTAGWPSFTAAIARLSAPASAFGSVTGPSPCAPMPRATVAKSMFGSLMVVPMSAFSMPRPWRAAIACRYMYSW